MDHAADSEKLLSSRGSLSSEETDLRSHLNAQRRERRLVHCYQWLTAGVVLLLLGSNIGWYRALQKASESRHEQIHTIPDHHGQFQPKVQEAVKLPGQDTTYFLEPGEPESILVPFEHDWTRLEEIDNIDGYRYGDAHWDPAVWAPPNGSAIAVPRSLQAELNLAPGAAATTDDTGKVHYLVAGYHQLHCMHVVRDTVYYLNGTYTEWPGHGIFQWSHVLHCIEAVRQALACFADPTLIPLDNNWPGIPNGQLHQCRNTNALYRWTNAHGHDTPEFLTKGEGPHTQEWLDRMAIQGHPRGVKSTKHDEHHKQHPRRES